MLLGLLVPTAAAGNPIRWVDDDAGAGGGPAACDSAPFTSIQDAIDASGTWDRVHVCPGTYEEQLVLDVKGVLVKSMPIGGAHIVAPAAMTSTGGIVSLVRMTAWGARLVGFHLDIAAGEPPIIVTGAGVSSAAVTCTPVDVAVLAFGQRSQIRRNTIDSIGAATLSGECGYSYGIVVGQEEPPALLPAPFNQISRAMVIRNTLSDFKWGGILVEGHSYKALVDRNTINHAHADDPDCQIISDCLIILAPTANVNSAFANPFGIAAEDGAAALIRRNTISSDEISPDTYTLFNGVILSRADSSSLIRRNTISDVNQGVSLAGGVPATAQAGVGGLKVSGNVISDTYTGIGIGDVGNEVYNNSVKNSLFGINVGGTFNLMHDNDVAGNGVFDCNDTGSSNVWVNNIALTDNPPGTCVDET